LTKQVYAEFRKAILSGALRPGEALPSTRLLAEQLGVSRTVVLEAYDQLLAEGYVAGRHGSGTYVAEGLTKLLKPVRSETAKIRLSRFGVLATEASDLNFPEERRKPLLYDFAYSRSPLDGFPFEQWRRILMAKARALSLRSLDYGPSAGSMALREAIAGHLRRSRAVECEPFQVIIVNGSQQVLDLTARVLLERGDRVVMEDPQYQGAREMFRAAGARLHLVAVDASGSRVDRLPARARLAFVTPSHQFPTGAVLTLERRLALLDWARRADAVILEDDYDGEFRYEGQPVESLQGLDRDGRVIYAGTFSRTIFPSLRIGYLVAPRSLVAAFEAAKWLCDRHRSTLEQEALAEFISSGGYERHLRRARRENALRRKVLLDAIAEHWEGRMEITGQGSGSHLVLWPCGGGSEERLIALAESKSVGVYGISRYYFKPVLGRVGLMLGYSRLNEREIKEGVKRLRLAWA